MAVAGIKRSGWFSPSDFYGALDAVRRVRELTWRQVADQSGVSASLFSRLAQGHRPDVDGFAALIVWSELDPGDYLKSQPVSPQLSPAGLGSALGEAMRVLRSDRSLPVAAVEPLIDLIHTGYKLAKIDGQNHRETTS